VDGLNESFVGTPLYVSPEMLSDCKTVPGSDLWSLGVMLFYMHTGQLPFKSDIQADLFIKIMCMEYEWPEGVEVSEDAKDLIERLLKINPIERLGAGKAGTPNDISQLMRHPYFEGISFSDLTTIPIPLSVNG